MSKKKKNPFIEVLRDFWGQFKQKYSGYATDYYESVVEKTIGCGDPQIGYIEYGCMYCGQHRHRVAFTCKTKFCLRCGRVFSERFVKGVMARLHEGVVYRHLILTIPEQLYSLFYKNRHDKKLYEMFYHCGWDFIKDVFSYVTSKKLHCGCIIVLHTAGRKGNYRPHLHIIVMNGGIDKISGSWINMPCFPYEKVLPGKWQYHLLKMVQNFDKGAEVNRLASKLYKKYPKGFVNFFMKGDVPKNSKKLVKYLSKYLFRPSISVKRILEYNKEKEEITYEYADHRSKKVEVERVGVLDFIGRMAQQILPKGFQRARYYGLQAIASYKKSQEKIHRGLSSELNLRDTFIAIATNQTYQERIKIWTGRDPMKCSGCGHEMELIKIWSSAKGVVFDLLESYRKKGQAPPDELLSLERVEASEPIDVIESVQLELAEFGLVLS